MKAPEIGLYPPLNKEAIIVNTLNDLPEKVEMADYNEFYRLYVDEENFHYVYKIKHPKSPLDQLIEYESNTNSTRLETQQD